MADRNRDQCSLVLMARSYALDVRPSRIQRQQFSAMMMGQFNTLNEETQREVADTLCLCHHIDLHVASMIADAPASISGRFIRFSPLLEEAMLSALIINGDLDCKLSIARRQNLPRAIARMLRDTCDEKINRALDLRQKPKRVTTQAPSFATSPVDKIMAAARARDLHSLCAVLVQRLSITQESAFVLLADKSSANLIIALKYCGLDENQAWETYALLAPGMAEVEGQQEAFRASYQTYDRDMCARTIRNWILDDLLSRVTAPSIANDQLGAPDAADLDGSDGMLKSA